MHLSLFRLGPSLTCDRVIFSFTRSVLLGRSTSWAPSRGEGRVQPTAEVRRPSGGRWQPRHWCLQQWGQWNLNFLSTTF